MGRYREDDHRENAPHFSAQSLEAVYEMRRGPPYKTKYAPYEYGPSD